MSEIDVDHLEDYTPTIETIESFYVKGTSRRTPEFVYRRREAAFRRFLAKHDADLREQIAREIDAERQEYMTPDRMTISQPYVAGLADAAGVVRRNGASA